MTGHTSPDLLDLAEAVASGELRADEAEQQVRASLGSDHDATAEAGLREMRRLVAAASAVRAHAKATHEAFGTQATNHGRADEFSAALRRGPVTAGSARRHASQDAGARRPRRTWLAVAAAIAIGTAVVGAVVVGGRQIAPDRRLDSTGHMTAGRAFHAAEPLADGRVLVVGGFGTGLVSLDSAELYDPKSNMFSATGSMASPRAGNPAIRLQDGRVLMVGGRSNPVATLSTAELYDPGAGTFGPTGSMTDGRGSGFTTTLLADGRVLVAGGKLAAELASAEVYDPRSGTFSPTGSMSSGRLEHTATLLADGRVLVTGGQGGPPGEGPTGLASAELYDPASGMFSPAGEMRTARVEHTATRLADGRVLVTGGLTTLAVGQGRQLALAELYDPTSNTFTSTGSMATARIGYTVTLLADGRVLIAGGFDLPNSESASGPSLASAEVYDPSTGTFGPTGSMATARAGQTATTLADGRILVTGGVEALTSTGPGPFLASAELYDPTTDTFGSIGP